MAHAFFLLLLVASASVLVVAQPSPPFEAPDEPISSPPIASPVPVPIPSTLPCSSRKYRLIQSLTRVSRSEVAPPTPKCPNNCSNHGTCNETALTCSCVGNWAGPSCSFAINPLKLGETAQSTIVVTNSSGQVSWNYWNVTVPKGDFLSVIVTPKDCTLNLYTLFAYPPTIANYDKAISAHSAQSIQYDMPSIGSWFVGLAATSNCGYSLLVNASFVCPNSCSGHGVCNGSTGVCECYKNYTSQADCSQALFSATNGVTTGSILPRVWSYYLYETDGNEMTINLTVTAKNAAKDTAADSPPGIYVRDSSEPTTFNYVKACPEVPFGGQCSLKFEQPKSGKWYIGIFGTSSASYSLSIAGTTQCPNGCSGYGTCGNNGVCNCPMYYTNPDCSVYRRALTPNTGTSAPILISTDQIQFFTYTSLGASNDISFAINQTTIQPNLHLVLLASCGITPSPLSFDYYAYCSTSESVCVISILKEPGCAWTFAVFATSSPPPSDQPDTPSPPHAAPTLFSKGVNAKDSSKHLYSTSIGSKSEFSGHSSSQMHLGMALADLVQVSYTVDFSTAIVCPNGCSGHGTCEPSGKCLCEVNYGYMIDCSLFVHSLLNDTSYFTTVATGEWRYYTLKADMDNYISFTITALQGAPIEAYLGNKPHFPTRYDYLKTIAPGNQTMYQLSATANSAPINGTWTLAIYGHLSAAFGNSSTTFIITALADRACPAGCSMNGYCTAFGSCVCNPGYVRPDCSALSIALPANLEVQGMVRFDTWVYYNLTVLGDDALEVWIQENDNLIYGLVWMFMAQGRLPTMEDHDFSNQTDTIMHSIFIPSGQTRGLWMIGVTGSPRATGSSYGRTAKYNLFATSGCGTYASCDTCVLDPNCGWCRNQPFDPAAGRCVPGNDQTSLNQTCLYYQYSSCSMKSDLNVSLMKGLVIGVSVGLFILLAACVTAFLLYRYYKQIEKSGLRPANIYNEGHGGGLPSPRYSNFIPRNASRGGKGGAVPTSNAAITAADLAERAILTDSSSAVPLTLEEGLPSIQDEYEGTPEVTTHSSGPSGYGTMEEPARTTPAPTEAVYYSFSPNQPYTDSEGDGDDMESDSEVDA